MKYIGVSDDSNMANNGKYSIAMLTGDSPGFITDVHKDTLEELEGYVLVLSMHKARAFEWRTE